MQGRVVRPPTSCISEIVFLVPAQLSRQHSPVEGLSKCCIAHRGSPLERRARSTLRPGCLLMSGGSSLLNPLVRLDRRQPPCS
jgi:hypothetical protein